MRRADRRLYEEKNQKAEELLSGVDYEQESDESDEDAYQLDEPYRSEDIRIDQKMFSLFQIYKWIERDNLLISPDFQRNFVWNLNKQSLLIESLMLKIPIPAFYFDEDESGNLTVIDGVQRLTTIYRFLRGEFRLRGLQYLQECEGCRYDELDWKYQLRIEDAQFAVNILDSKCPSMVKFDLFRRINTGGMPLNPQEVRNIMAHQKTRELLRKMAESREFLRATHERVSDVRMGAQELCLRFITYYELYDDKKGKFIRFGEMNRLLDEMVLELNHMKRHDLAWYYDRFVKSMDKCYALFGKKTFSKPGVKYTINRALFTSFGILLAESQEDAETLEQDRDRACELLEDMLARYPEYYNSITSSTSSRRNMEIQFEFARKILEEL